MANHIFFSSYLTDYFLPGFIVTMKKFHPRIVIKIEELKAEGHNYLYYVELPEQNEADGMGTDFHPSAVTQTKTVMKQQILTQQ